MVKEKPETKEPKKTEIKTFLDDIDLDELVDTTWMDILPKYDLIPKDDLLTSRKVKILVLPKQKYIEKTKDGKVIDKELWFMAISDNDVKYSLNADSIALRRSIGSIAIKLSKAKVKSEIDLSKVLNVLVGIKRREFTAKGFKQAPLQFFLLSE